jgi:hypothetical protein
MTPLGKAGEPWSWEVDAEMHRPSPRDDQPSEPLMRRLDRVAGEMNPFLIVLLVGLLILNLTRLSALGLSNFPITRVDPSCLTSPASTISGVGAVKRPD